MEWSLQIPESEFTRLACLAGEWVRLPVHDPVDVG